MHNFTFVATRESYCLFTKIKLHLYTVPNMIGTDVLPQEAIANTFKEFAVLATQQVLSKFQFQTGISSP